MCALSPSPVARVLRCLTKKKTASKVHVVRLVHSSLVDLFCCSVVSELEKIILPHLPLQNISLHESVPHMCSVNALYLEHTRTYARKRAQTDARAHKR